MTVRTVNCGLCASCVVCGQRDVFLEDTKEAFAGKKALKPGDCLFVLGA